MPSLVEALEQKYGEVSTSDGSEDESIVVAIYVPCKSPRAAIPSLLVLNDCDITTAGEHEALVAKCGCVEELDLAKNKLDKWPEVLEILQHMPRLKFVNLSFNHLALPLKEAQLSTALKWQELRNLVLNSTFISWESVQEILEHLPSLEELHLSLNDYSSVELRDDLKLCCYQPISTCNCPNMDQRTKHMAMRTFHFTGNLVSEWKEICKLGYVFPNLESLVVAECPIQSLNINALIDCDDARDQNSNGLPYGGFHKLKFLNLNSTQLKTWDDIERLSRFPALKSLRVQSCPLWESNEYTEHERRQLLISRLPNVEMLNGGGPIEADEREDAERAFIRYYMDKPESDRPNRYFELVQIHGKLDPLVHIDLRPEKRIKVTITCGSNSEIRSLDVYRTVSDLKSKLETFAGFSAAKMRLFYVDQDLRDIQGPEEMKYPNKQLYSYNIQSGDEIIIDSKKKIKDEQC